MPRIVDPHVTAIEMMQSEPKYTVDLFAVADIAGQSEGAISVAYTSTGGFGASRIAGKHHYIGTMVGEDFRNGFTDAHGSAGDDDHFPGEIFFREAHAELLVFREGQVKVGVQSSDALSARP
jgi:hypothetical protein